MKTCPLTLVAGSVLLIGSAHAAIGELADLSLEDLMKVEVTSASKYAQSAGKAPSAVTVVTSDEIRRFGWRNLSDVLAAQRGFHAYYDRSYHYLGVRGFAPPGDYNSRIQFLVDGQRLNDNIYDSVMAGESFPLDLDLVERIEIIRGPGAAMYGGNSMFGVINLITRTGESVGRAELAAEAGSKDSYRLRASTGGRSGEMEWLVSASGFDSDGDRYVFPDIAPGQRSPSGGDADRSQRLFARLRLSDWSASFIHSDRTKHRPGGQWGTIFDNPSTRERDEYNLGELAGQHRLDEHSALDLRLFAGQYIYEFVGANDYSGSGGAPLMFNRDDQVGEWWGGEMRWTSTAWTGHALIAGLNWTKNSRQAMRNADDDGTVYPPVVDTDSSRTGVFVQDEYAVNASTTLTIGLRHDIAEDHKSFTSPRLALVHELNPANTLKLLYGTAFRNANLYERLYTGYGNPALDNEGIRTLEGVWESRLDNQTRLTTSLYRYRVTDPIGYDSASGINLNGEKVEGAGVEAEIERRWSSGALLRGSYSGQFLSQDNQRPDNAPAGLLQVLAGMPVGPEGMFAALEIRGLTGRDTGSGTARLGGHVLANATLSWRVRASPWEWSASVYNLFDKNYYDPAPADPLLAAVGVNRDRFEQDGRTFRLKMVARF